MGVIIRSSITAVIAALAAASPWRRDPPKGWRCVSFPWMERPVSWRSGGTLRTQPSPISNVTRFWCDRPASNWAPLRCVTSSRGGTTTGNWAEAIVTSGDPVLQ